MDDQLTCILCLCFDSEFSDDYYILTKCSHYFHYKCIFKIIQQDDFSLKSRCPICQEPLKQEEFRKIYGLLGYFNYSKGKEGQSAGHSTINKKSSYSFGNELVESEILKLNSAHLNYTFKIVVLGDSGVGKSSLLKRFYNNSFNEDLNATSAIDLLRKDICINEVNVRLIMWDTAGQERFKTIIPAILHNVHGILLVFNTTDYKTFRAIEEWNIFCDEYGPSSNNVVKLLVGNQIDMKDKRQVSKKEGKKLGTVLDIPYLETSAKDNVNVEALFKTLAGKILENNWILEDIEERSNDTNIVNLASTYEEPPENNEEDSSCGKWFSNSWKNFLNFFR